MSPWCIVLRSSSELGWTCPHTTVLMTALTKFLEANPATDTAGSQQGQMQGHVIKTLASSSPCLAGLDEQHPVLLGGRDLQPSQCQPRLLPAEYVTTHVNTH